MFVFGGISAITKEISDLCCLNLSTHKWTQF